MGVVIHIYRCMHIVNRTLTISKINLLRNAFVEKLYLKNLSGKRNDEYNSTERAEI
jgi:hypothetical protein